MQLQALWDRVEISNEERDRFQAQVSGVSQKTIDLVSITELSINQLSKAQL